ncbi:ABC transporter ATP-binding protein [Rhodococcus rhodnii]|uniref:ABC transporter n=2 Tax=Rhodococcus rhodnii TaxID=38312 RepID=R7WTI5_9NOCA|nr:ABC transporter ATP-binding protein [Rhodococcus rhodnii]EOM77449.1 ABC transporter [Rhodococcus rhodnii LMG 5362]TXG90330.1 ABC transporter ATP-binding protein [Rhodococcus rhodnii]
MPSGRDGADAMIEVAGVRHEYGRGADAVVALGPIDLTVSRGESAVLVGASGCGKSTLLRLIAGFESPTDGAVRVAGGEPEPGRCGVVFQQPRLFAWKTVGGNVDTALRYAGVPRGERASRRDALLESVGLHDVAHRRIWELSGGQQHRVAIARAYANDTEVLLLDEPFGALDALTRERLQEDFLALGAASGRTTVFVTHSAEEAVLLGSRVIVLGARPGRIALDLAVDLPRELGPSLLRRTPEFVELHERVRSEVRAAAGEGPAVAPGLAAARE